MALPASGPISGSQISAELGTGATNISLGGMADTASFSAPDAYSDFYGYGSLTLFYMGNAGTVPKPACSQDADNAAYHDGAGSLPTTGDIVYTDAAGTTTKGNGTYGVDAVSGSSPSSTITINGGAGSVSQVGSCKG
jgi:hypothetical protein